MGLRRVTIPIYHYTVLILSNYCIYCIVILDIVNLAAPCSMI